MAEDEAAPPTPGADPTEKLELVDAYRFALDQGVLIGFMPPEDMFKPRDTSDGAQRDPKAQS